MKLINTEDAVGHVLCHDMTQIIPGAFKGPLFKKGHIVTKEDIPVLLSIGKEHLYVWERDENMLHEDEAAQVLCEICAGENMHPTGPSEGKIELIADCDGLLKINREKLRAVNMLGEMMIASRHGDSPVKKAAILTTGSEVYKGLIRDRFTPVIEKKLHEFGIEVIFREFFDDDPDALTDGCLRAIRAGAKIVLCTGGMSVDPDDRTPLAIRNTGARVVTYGAPVLPGAMFMLAYYEAKNSETGNRGAGKKTVPIAGLPGCAMYAKRTIFDLMLPRLAAGDEVKAEELAALGEGGLCLQCSVCTYPNCGFGKGR